MTYTRRQYAELGGLLASAMIRDYTVNTRAVGMERDVFDKLTRLYMKDPANFKDNALEACHHAGFTERDIRSMTDWVENRLFRFWCVGAVRFHSLCERENEENRAAYHRV